METEFHFYEVFTLPNNNQFITTRIILLVLDQINYQQPQPQQPKIFSLEVEHNKNIQNHQMMLKNTLIN